MNDYEKNLRKKLKRDTLIGLAIVGLVVAIFYATIFLLKSS